MPRPSTDPASQTPRPPWLWRLARSLRSGAERALDLVLPPRCLGCGCVVSAGGAVCPSCWADLAFLAPPHCACCGHPFDLDPDDPAALCGGCLKRRPVFVRARAALVYDDASRPLILGFKHGDQTHAAAAYAAWMARAGPELLAAADLIAPVPLHRWRFLRRRYNQAALLALALGRVAGRPVVPDLLIRRRRTIRQGGLSRRARRANVSGAFALAADRAPLVKGCRVLLIDDVLTTGATVTACTRPLLRAGAQAVDVLTLARVVRGQD